MTTPQRVEGYNSDWIGVLAGQEILQDALMVGVSLIRFTPGATGARAEVFKHQIDVAVEARLRRSIIAAGVYSSA